jgi:hypothetical protein
MHNLPNLNKENFWNEMHIVYPGAVNLFYKWIDEYKDAINWDQFFKPGIKFHDIPYEFQMGIMNRFFIESFASNEEYYADGETAKEYHDEMRDALKQLNIKTIEQQSK